MVVGSVIEFKDKSSNPRNGLSHENKYMYLGKAKMKHPDTREWIKCACTLTYLILSWYMFGNGKNL